MKRSPLTRKTPLKAKKGLNKVRKTSKSAMKRKADKLFSLKIRSKGYCELKGFDEVKCSGQLQTMHIIGRANHNLRWDEKNALCGCSGHHFYYTNNPTLFGILISLEFPERMDYLLEHRNEVWDKNIEAVLEGLE